MKRLLIILISILLLFNCAKILQKKPLSTEGITFQEIRNRVEQNHWKLHSIKGNAYFSMETPGMGFTAVSQIALKTPDTLLLKVKAGFGMGVGSIFIAKNRFVIFSSMENRVYYGDINSFDLSRFLQVNIKFQDLIGIISGIPIISEAEHSSFVVDKNKYLIVIKNDQQTKKYWVDPNKFVITDFHLYDAKDEIIVEQEFRSFQKQRGVILPKTIKITHPQGKQRVTLQYTARKTNGKIKQKDFVIKIPANAQKIDL